MPDEATKLTIDFRYGMLVLQSQRPEIAVAGKPRPTPERPLSTKSGSTNFFRGTDHPGGGEQVLIQGHASPGTYARADLEGRVAKRISTGSGRRSPKHRRACPRTRIPG
jgi:pyruvate dehydrogenase E1 component